MGIIEAVIGYLGLVVVFYLQVLLPQIIGGLLAALLAGPKKRRKISLVTDRPDFLPTTDAEDLNPDLTEGSKSNLTVARIVGAMDGCRVLLKLSFGDSPHYHRVAIAWVRKPRAGKRLPTVTFVLLPPDEPWPGRMYEVQVPDEQLGDFEEVENRKGVYRLTSVLHVDDSEIDE
jgi:hypothetical protein